MSKSIKCIIRQDWTTRDADGNLIERKSRVYVTDDNGMPHIYDSIKEARAEIIANYGRDANRAGILHSHSVNDYTGNVHDSYIVIVREDSEEYAEAIEQAQRETFARNHIVKYISREGAEELHALRFEKAFSWYELAQRYGITEHQARKAYNIIHYNKTRAFEYDTEAERIAAAAQIVAEAMNEASEAMEEAREAERKTADAAIDYDPETAAKYAAEAEAAAKRAEKAAQKAWSAANTPEACSTAEIVSEYAAHARRDADSATETAKQSAEEAKSIKDVNSYAHDAKAYANAAAWTLDRMTEDHPETAAELARFARTCADHAKDAAENAVASYEYARHTYYADHERSAYAAQALAIRAEQRDDAQQEAQRAEETAQKVEALAVIESHEARQYFTAEAIAHQWSAKEISANAEYARNIIAANAAALAFLAAYEDATSEHPTEDETRAAYRVARDELTGADYRATLADYRTVNAMVEAIAVDVEYCARIRVFMADNAARDLLNAYAETMGAPADAEETDAAYRVARHDIAHELGSTRADREAVDLMTDIVARSARRPDLAKYAGSNWLVWSEDDDPNGATQYQRHELEAFLDNPAAYDVDAIEDDATTWKDGTLYWRPGIDLAAIAEAHALTA